MYYVSQICKLSYVCCMCIICIVYVYVPDYYIPVYYLLLYIYIYLYHAFKCILSVYHAGHVSYVYPSCQVYSRLATHNIHNVLYIHHVSYVYCAFVELCVL